MTSAVDDSDVSAGDAVAWLQEEGLPRLVAFGEGAGPAVAFTVDVGTGLVTMFPATGRDSSTRAADDLPVPAPNARRLVTVGVTNAGALLVLDLTGSLSMAVNGENPEHAVRAWTLQLLLNPEVVLTTNSGDVVPAASPRCKKSFIPGGGGRLLSVDDGKPPVTTIEMNPDLEGADYLEVAPDGTGGMYLGARFWPLSHVLTVADQPWSILTETLAEADA